MRILGIDPGLAHLGYGVVSHDRGATSWVASGEIQTPASQPHHQRLSTIYADLSELIATYGPHTLAVERLPYVAKFNTASQVSEVCGVLAAVAGSHDLAFAEYSPKAVKLAITGDGKAEKGDVIAAVRHLLDLGKVKLSSHAADALAVALTHAQEVA